MLVHDIEELPYKSPMISLLDDNSSSTYVSEQQSSFTTYDKEMKDGRDPTSAQPHSVSKKKHFEKVSCDLNHVCVSIASTIETPEQWIEFCENTGGLVTILNCIHDVVQEIKGRTVQVDDYFEPLLGPDDIDGFHTACSACRVLRDLCAKDTLWASAITDEIIQLNQNGTFISDLLFLLHHTDEAERISSKKAWRMRRVMKENGFYARNLKTGKQRRGKKNNNNNSNNRSGRFIFVSQYHCNTSLLINY
jgi:hypothetical protein